NKDATEADADLSNVGDTERYYAVWEEDKNAQIELNHPDPVEVEDLNHLSDDEKQAVKDAIKAKNPDLSLTDEDIKVADDGQTWVNHDGKQDKLEPNETIKQKENQTEINPPEQTVVADPENLTEVEKQAVKDAVKKANE